MERPLCGTTHTSSGTAGIGCTRTGIIGHVLEIPLIFHLVGKEFLLRTLMPLFMYGPGPRTSSTFSKGLCTGGTTVTMTKPSLKTLRGRPTPGSFLRGFLEFPAQSMQRTLTGGPREFTFLKTLRFLPLM